jgi:plastocyanin
MRKAFPLLVLCVLVACGNGGDAGSADGEPVRTDQVEMPKSYRFEPPAIEVEVGTAVTWVNNDDFPHNVTLLDGSGVSEPVPIGASASVTFEEPGEVPYECSLHPQQMQGRVVVV